MQPLLVAEEDDLVVVYKPAGFVVYATRPEDADFDLRAWLQRTTKRNQAPLHRIDRETSGLVLFSHRRDVRSSLGMAFADGEVDKQYLALVHGRTNEKGIIRRELTDLRRRRPLPAVTRYSTVEWLGGFSLVRVRPETGRKHQIRRHLQSIGHALVGDERYRPKKFQRVPAFPGRLWLHAHQITLPDGRSWEAPLPTRLAQNLDALREGLSRDDAAK